MNGATQQYSRHVSVHSGEGTRVDKAVTIRRPVSDVYSFWRRLENLPQFMQHLECVTEHDHLHSHWVANTVAGKQVGWDAEIIEERPNEMISWRSAPGSEVDNAGSVWFSTVPGGQGTMVRVELKYVPPAGMAGELVARIFGGDAESEIEEDLLRLKTYLETGRVPEKLKTSASLSQSSRKSIDAATGCIRENPWTAVISTVVIGLVLGFLLGRRAGLNQASDDWPEI